MSWRTAIVSNRCKLELKLGYMMLAHPQMDTLFDFSGDGINTLVIEAPSFFRQFLQDISLQVSGLEGKAVLSQNNMPITFSKFAEVLDSFLSFEISKKSLVSKLQARLEAEALNERNYVRTMQLLGEVEQFIQELSFELPCTVACDKISIDGVIRSAGIEILTSKDAKKLYTQCTAAVLRMKDQVMKTATSLQENCGDILADAKEINEQRAAEDDAVVEDAADKATE